MKSRTDKKNYTNVAKKKKPLTTLAKPEKNWILSEEKAYRLEKMWYIDVCMCLCGWITRDWYLDYVKTPKNPR